MEDYLGLVFFALFYIVPWLLKRKKRQQSESPPKQPYNQPLFVPIPKREMPPVHDIPLEIFATEPKEMPKTTTHKKSTVFVRKVKKKRNIHALLKTLPSNKETFIISEILKRR